MSTAKPERRRFQFSLRKALIWMVVWALCLGYIRWMNVSPYFLAMEVLYVGTLLTIRLWFGYRAGLIRAAVLTAGVPFVLLIADILSSAPGDSDKAPFMLLLCLLAALAGIVAFTLIHLLVSGIDWIDRKMESKPEC